MTVCSERCKYTAHLSSTDTSRRIHHIADFEAVELACSTDGVRTHVIETQPVPNL